MSLAVAVMNSVFARRMPPCLDYKVAFFFYDESYRPEVVLPWAA